MHNKSYWDFYKNYVKLIYQLKENQDPYYIKSFNS